jgi:hypothetical protein
MVALLLLLAAAGTGLSLDWSSRPPLLPDALGIEVVGKEVKVDEVPLDRDFFVGSVDEAVLTLGYGQLRARSAKTGEVLWQRMLGEFSVDWPREIEDLSEKGAFFVPFIMPQHVGRVCAHNGRYVALATHLQGDKRVLIQVWDAGDGKAVRSFTVPPLSAGLELPYPIEDRLALTMGEEGITAAGVSPECDMFVERRGVEADVASDWRCTLPMLSGSAEGASVLVCAAGNSVFVFANWLERGEGELHRLDATKGTELQSLRLPFSVYQATYVAEKKILLLAAYAVAPGDQGASGKGSSLIAAIRADDCSTLWKKSAEGMVSWGKPGLRGNTAYILVLTAVASRQAHGQGDKVPAAQILRLDVSTGKEHWSREFALELDPPFSYNAELRCQWPPFVSPVLVGDQVLVVLPTFAYDREDPRNLRYQAVLLSSKNGKELARLTLAPPAGPRGYVERIGPLGVHPVGGRVYLDTLEGSLFALTVR